jgi:hypothetical protein
MQYEVTLSCDIPGWASITVEADSPEEAEEEALAQAGALDWDTEAIDAYNIQVSGVEAVREEVVPVKAAKTKRSP